LRQYNILQNITKAFFIFFIILNIKNISPKPFISLTKLGCPWIKKDLKNNNLPYFTHPFLEKLKSWNTSSWNVFHWTDSAGNLGYTSAWFAKNSKTFTCIELSKAWQKAFLDFCKIENIKNCKSFLKKPEIKIIYTKLFGKKNLPTVSNLGENSSYVKVIDTLNQKYDCIIIDGQHRNVCAKFALKHIKPNGIIILNNSNQASIGINSQKTYDLLSKYEHHSYKQPDHIDWCTDYWIIK